MDKSIYTVFLKAASKQQMDIKWRSSKTKRRWLLGIVTDHMCALLDTGEFVSMLKTGDDNILTL